MQRITARLIGYLALCGVFLIPAGCINQHDAQLQEVNTDDCVTCHRPDYEAVVDPMHVGVFPETCGQCHTTDAWRPALEGAHPEANFPVAEGPHKSVECVECHKASLGPSTDGQNTDCIGCHTGEHNRAKMDDKHHEEPDYNWRDAVPNFCLECHPNGRHE